jgi:hypothetical protein
MLLQLDKDACELMKNVTLFHPSSGEIDRSPQGTVLRWCNLLSHTRIYIEAVSEKRLQEILVRKISMADLGLT